MTYVDKRVSHIVLYSNYIALAIVPSWGEYYSIAIGLLLFAILWVQPEAHLRVIAADEEVMDKVVNLQINFRAVDYKMLLQRKI